MVNHVCAASPWSAPSWLKTWNSLIAYSPENTLLDTDEAYNTYSTYLVKVFEAYQNQGITIDYFMLQNEPLFGTSSEYPGMYFSAQQEVRLGKLLTHDSAAPWLFCIVYGQVSWSVPSWVAE